MNILVSSASHLQRLGVALMQVLDMDCSQLSIIQEQSQGNLLIDTFKGRINCTDSFTIAMLSIKH